MAATRAKKRRGYFRFVQKMAEFYLSDANLRRDAFIRSRLDHNLEMDASVLLACNRLRAVEATLDDLKTALKPSHTLQITSGAGGGCTLRRTQPVQPKSKLQVDKCTVYVERVPADATHDWLCKAFSSCGHVALVSLPKYKHNKMLKGYAFVEFSDEAGCQAAIDKFASLVHATTASTALPCPLCQSCPQPLCQSCLLPPPAVTSALSAAPPAPSPTLEIEPETSESQVLQAFGADDAPDDHGNDDAMTAGRHGNSDAMTAGSHGNSDAMTAGNHGDGVVEEEQQPVKRKRNRKKKKWQKRGKFPLGFGLQVMSKLAWNELRDRYLSVQTLNRRAVKTHLLRLRRPVAMAPGVGKKGLLPGCVLTITASKPVSDTESKTLRSTLKQLCEGVEYVDVEPGQQSGYVRMTSAEAAAKLVRSPLAVAGYRLQLLPPEAEHLYWVKIEHDRDRRQRRKRNSSGAKKLILRAERQLAVKMRLSPNQ